MELFSLDTVERLSRLIFRNAGVNVTLTGSDSELLKAAAFDMIAFDPDWNKKRFLEDFLLIEPEKGNIKIEKAREAEALLLHKPSKSKRKYILIHQCERMTTESANAFLKIMEEPPAFATIVMTTTSWNSLLATIRSRTIPLAVEVPWGSLERLKEIYAEKVTLVYPSAVEDYSVLNHFLQRKPDVLDEETFEVGDDISEISKRLEDCQGEDPEDKIRRRKAYAVLLKRFVGANDFFAFFREVIPLFAGQNGFQRSRELVSLVRNLLRDMLIIDRTSSWNLVKNIDLIEWLMDHDSGPHILEDLLWCDKFLRQRTASLNFALVIFRAAVGLRRNCLTKQSESGGN